MRGELSALLGGAAARDVTALGEAMRDLLPRLPRRSADLVVWVCNLMLAVTAHEAENRMGSGAIIAVMAPVLMRGAAPDAEVAAHDDTAAAAAAAVAEARRGVQLVAALFEAHRRAPLTRVALPQNALRGVLTVKRTE